MTPTTAFVLGFLTGAAGGVAGAIAGAIGLAAYQLGTPHVPSRAAR